MNWRKLEVYEDGYLGRLGELVEDAPANLDTCEIAEDGSIGAWPQHMVAAAGEEPDWDTPRATIDWTGFRQALVSCRGTGDIDSGRIVCVWPSQGGVAGEITDGHCPERGSK